MGQCETLTVSILLAHEWDLGTEGCCRSLNALFLRIDYYQCFFKIFEKGMTNRGVFCVFGKLFSSFESTFCSIWTHIDMNVIEIICNSHIIFNRLSFSLIILLIELNEVLFMIRFMLANIYCILSIYCSKTLWEKFFKHCVWNFLKPHLIDLY